jgi:uncharacterized paraquat-inducible protein A
MTLLCPQCRAIVAAPDLPLDTALKVTCRKCLARLVITIVVEERIPKESET